MIIILEIEKKIGYEFKDKSLIETALTHSSYANEHKVRDNERLEFLGDSVLSVIISEHIYKRLDDVKEGELSKFRAILVCEASLSAFAKKSFIISSKVRLSVIFICFDISDSKISFDPCLAK